MSIVSFQETSLNRNLKIVMVLQPFHLVDESPWPLTGAIGAFGMTVGLVSWFHGYGINYLIVGVALVIATMIFWWRDVIREGTYLGFHTGLVCSGLRLGMLLFILSEVIFFFGFF